MFEKKELNKEQLEKETGGIKKVGNINVSANNSNDIYF